MMPHVMVDLETMGKEPTAPIVAIGACSFNAVRVVSLFYVPVSLASSAKAGAQIEPNTVMWWLGQSDKARAALTGGVDLVQALRRFTDWCDNLSPEGVIGMWGNGATFDNVILDAAYKAVDVPRPKGWTYKTDRCYRTVRAMFPGVPMEDVGVAHHARDDAEAQALHLLKINRKYGEFLVPGESQMVLPFT